MIDVHNHILPGIDDGAKNVSVSLEMARLAVADGITSIVCTPHITPGVYANNASLIEQSVVRLRRTLMQQQIPLELLVGADIHITPDMVSCLESGEYPTLAGSRYLLFEPSHHLMPPAMSRLCKQLLGLGYIPILTHPERLSWIENRYHEIVSLAKAGVAMQLTAGSVTGNFGSRAQYWSERMLEEGHVDVVASDSHDAIRRKPELSNAREKIAQMLGGGTAEILFEKAPRAIVANDELPDCGGGSRSRSSKNVVGVFERLIGR